MITIEPDQIFLVNRLVSGMTMFILLAGKIVQLLRTKLYRTGH